MKISHKARHGRKRHPVPHKPHRGVRTYSRWPRIWKAWQRERDDAEFDAEEMAVRSSRPLSSAFGWCGAVGLSPDYSQKRASTVGAVSPLTTKRGS